MTHYYSGRLRPAYLRNRELYDHLVLLFTESVRGMQTVKGFAAEPLPNPALRGRQLPGIGAAEAHLP